LLRKNKYLLTGEEILMKTKITQQPNTDCDTKFTQKTLNYLCHTRGKTTMDVPFKNLLVDYSCYIPGLKCTNVAFNCYDMVPQGICTTEKYILISMYCNVANTGHSHHKSAINVIDKCTGAFIKTLIMPNTDHIGGIAYDGDYLWVCGTSVYKDSKKKKLDHGIVTAYTFSEVDNLITNINKGIEYVTIITAKKNDFVVNTPASFCACYNGYLYVGTFKGKKDDSDVESQIIGRHIIKYGNTLMLEDNANTNRSIPVEVCAQGVTFITYHDDIYMAVTRSWIRVDAADDYISELSVYKGNSWGDLKGNAGHIYKRITLPPMVEGIVIDNIDAYYIFESAANVYCNGTDGGEKCEYPNNRICRSRVFGLII
jgi:hypothetical protein